MIGNVAGYCIKITGLKSENTHAPVTQNGPITGILPIHKAQLVSLAIRLAIISYVLRCMGRCECELKTTCNNIPIVGSLSSTSLGAMKLAIRMFTWFGKLTPVFLFMFHLHPGQSRHQHATNSATLQSYNIASYCCEAMKDAVPGTQPISQDAPRDCAYHLAICLQFNRWCTTFDN